MAELVLLAEQSDSSTLVLSRAGSSEQDRELFTLPITDELISVVEAARAHAEHNETGNSHDEQPDRPHLVVADDGGEPTQPDSKEACPPAGDHDDTPDARDEDEPAGDSSPQAIDAPAGPDAEQDTSEDKNTGQESGQPRPARPSPDPRLSAPLPMTPREIQHRIRAGASLSEVASLCDLPESRIEPFAYAVLQERERIAALARSCKPTRSDGMCPMTLGELAATALAAEKIPVSTARWDAWRNEANQWVVGVSYTHDGVDERAEWTVAISSSGTQVVAANDLAMAMTEPDDEPGQFFPTVDEVDEAESTDRDDLGNGDEDSARLVSLDETHETDGDDSSFFVSPTGDKPKRRRRAQTPHWEDVLLGVRASTKRPKK